MKDPFTNTFPAQKVIGWAMWINSLAPTPEGGRLCRIIHDSNLMDCSNAYIGFQDWYQNVYEKTTKKYLSNLTLAEMIDCMGVYLMELEGKGDLPEGAEDMVKGFIESLNEAPDIQIQATIAILYYFFLLEESL